MKTNKANTDSVKKSRRYDGKRKSLFTMQRSAQTLLPNERVHHCMRTHLSSNGVAIFQHSNGKTSLGNVTTCGSVWHCPICAAKITETRRIELQQAINKCVAQGGAVYLMTQTFPHQLNQHLDENLQTFTVALQKFKNSRTYKKVMEQVAHIGSIRALEVTYGQNGWHPHTHTLVFGEAGRLKLLQELEGIWIKILLKLGLADQSQMNDLLTHAFDVQDGKCAAEYVAKLGHTFVADRPLTHKVSSNSSGHASAISVKNRISGRSPFDLLSDYGNGDCNAGKLFIEFAASFKGRRQLFWSRGLKQALRIPLAEISDEDITRSLVTIVEPASWKTIIRLNAQWMVLEAARRGSDAVQRLLKRLARRKPPLPQTPRSIGRTLSQLIHVHI